LKGAGKTRKETGPLHSLEVDMALGARGNRLVSVNKGHPMTRKLLIRLTSACFALTALLGTANAGIPAMNVTVFDASEKVVFRQAMNADATFATGNLRPGKYVVQFNARNAAVKGNQYLLVVSAGKKKVIADSVAGETLGRGGAAMKIQVGSSSQISGQVLNDEAIAKVGGPKYRTIDGKRYLWVNAELGSHLQGHWEEAGTGPARSVFVWTKDELQKRMDRGGEGSMLANHPSYIPPPTGY